MPRSCRQESAPKCRYYVDLPMCTATYLIRFESSSCCNDFICVSWVRLVPQLAQQCTPCVGSKCNTLTGNSRLTECLKRKLLSLNIFCRNFTAFFPTNCSYGDGFSSLRFRYGILKCSGWYPWILFWGTLRRIFLTQHLRILFRCCRGEVSATGRSLVQRSATEWCVWGVTEQ
jgi:hypothetical protein